MAFVGVLLLPLALSNYVIDTSNVPVFSGISALLVAVTLFFYRNKTPLQIPRFVASILLFYFFVNLASISWSINQAAAVYESIKVFLTLAALLLFYALFENKILQQKLFQLFAIGALLVTGIALWQYVADGQITGAVLGHKNLLASFLLLSLAFGIYLIFNSNSKTLAALLTVVFLTVLIVLRVRSSYLALLAGIICFTVSQILYVKKLNVGLLFSALALTLLFLIPLIPGFERFALLSFKSSDSGVERLKIWQKTWLLFLEKPVFGVGADNWQFVYQKFGVGDIAAVRNSGITFQRPHNDFLWILSETGLVGFTLIIGVISYTAYHYHKKQKQKANTTSMLLFSALFALLVDAFFSLDKERPLLILYSAVLFAALLRQLTMPYELQNVKRSLVMLGLTIILCFGIFVSLFRLKGEYHTQQLLVSKSNNDLTQMSIHGRKALSAFYNCDPTSTPIASYIGYAYERMNRADSMLVYTEQAYQLTPYDYEVLNNYGMMLARAGQMERADTLLKEAYRINPHFEVTRLNLAVLAFNRKKIKEAKQWLNTIPNHQVHYPAQTEAIMNAKD